MMIIKSHYIAVIISTAMFFTGCAVLTVDVDVYKGPLANHEDVQIEQMAAMAIGAKSLLVELRDELEGNDPNRMNKIEGNHGAAGFRELANKECWYKPKYIAPPSEGTKSRFINQNADRINDILFLYEDRGDEQYFVIFVRPAKQALKDYKTNYTILRPESPETDRQLWKKIGLCKDSFEDEAKVLLSDGNEDVKELAKEIESLRVSYEDFCTNNRFREVNELFVKWNKIQHLLTKNQIKIPDYLQNATLLKDRDRELEVSSNAGFIALAETSLVDFQAEHIFRLKDKRKSLFVDHIKKISRAFLKTNEALERLWHVEMETIIWLSDQHKKINLEPEQSIREIARASIEIIEPWRVAVLNNLLKVVDPNTVSGFVQLNTETQWYQDWVPADHENAKEQLLTKFSTQPAETARKLLNAHKYAIEKLSPEFLTKQRVMRRNKDGDMIDYIWYPSGWKFGLTQIPFDKIFRVSLKLKRNKTLREKEKALIGKAVSAEKIVSESMIKYTGLAFPTSAFGKGRLDEGLETLIEDYLKKATICDPNEKELKWARRRLQDALVRFAQKLLFVANNRSLMSPPEQYPGLITGTFSGIYRFLFGEKSPKQLTEKIGNPVMKSPFDDPEQDYTRILQAVGNSILVQADALHQEKKHRERLENHYKKEAVILRETVSRMSPVHGNTVDIHPIKKLLPKSATAKDIRDVWIELLQYEHDLALYYGDTERAEQIKEALEAAQKKREDMIFIRPAMAYLRTSFPATSLQSNPNLTWDNMLGGHMMRSMPFGPQLRDLFNPDAKRDAQINAEIDKQFWQNINRVRVAGGGDINYAVVKDDIGNWYVKGYSSNPKDIINSAKNLAMYSLSGKMNTLPGQLGFDKSDKEAKKEPDTDKSSLWKVFSKYQEDYKDRTKKDYDKLDEILEEEIIKSRITKAWHENESLNESDIVSLNKELNEAYSDYLEPASKELLKSTEKKEKETKKETEKREKEEAERSIKIAKTIQKIRLFHNALLNKILVRLTDSPAEKLEKAKIAKDKAKAEAEEATKDDEKAELAKAVKTEEANVKAKQEEFKKAKNAAHVAQGEVTRIVREELMEIITSRKDAVKDYETALMFIGETCKN